ncbi:hypothetical protein Barb6XT_02853 [Bacteroidales bacterium Barb6XT]|nr:hypothetical protein Barb6XT_02853 [Bacteroidales bacterium Barb6XT]
MVQFKKDRFVIEMEDHLPGVCWAGLVKEIATVLNFREVQESCGTYYLGMLFDSILPTDEQAENMAKMEAEGN